MCTFLKKLRATAMVAKIATTVTASRATVPDHPAVAEVESSEMATKPTVAQRIRSTAIPMTMLVRAMFTPL